MSRVRVLLNILESNAANNHDGHQYRSCRDDGLKTLQPGDSATPITYALCGLENDPFLVVGQTL
jgi:hypothetical protein